MLEFADLITALQRKNVTEKGSGISIGISGLQNKRMAITSYDIGGLLIADEPDFLGEEKLIELGLYDDFRQQPILSIPNATIMRQRQDHYVFVFVAGVFDEGLVVFRHDPKNGWVKFRDDDGLYENFWFQGQVLVAEAETNVEPAKKQGGPNLTSLNKRRGISGLNPIPKTRVISLSTPRRIAEPSEKEIAGTSGGTHARPVEHLRVLDGRWIYPKNRRAYWRKAQTVVVNEGVARTAITFVKP